MSELSITVTISDRPYKLVVDSEDEALFREAAQQINDRIQTYSKNYAFKDRQDLLAMVSLQYTFKALKSERIESYKSKELLQKLNDIDKMLNL
ncbi:MAG: cell division protein ZapA [Bacteroidales bacterium]